MCALFFFCFSVLFFFFLHSPLLTPSAARRERHAYCDFVGGRRNGGAWSRRSCMAVMFCWWCIHCVGAVRVKSWQAAPPPTPWLLPPPRVASMFYALCCAQRLRSDSNCSSGFWFEFGFGFRFGFSISSVWAEFGVDWDWAGDWDWAWDGVWAVWNGCVAWAATVAIEVYLWPTAFG